MNILVSACLLGKNCKYNGGNNLNETVQRLKEKYNVIPVCPETLGGLKSPREPAEISGKAVLLKSGTDVTEPFLNGAQKTLETALENGCKVAVLKAKSPSCGSGEVYDGTFSKTVISGDGVAAALLKRHGIKVYTENDVNMLL